MTDLLRTITDVCESLNINWKIIGNLALPAYSVTRTKSRRYPLADRIADRLSKKIANLLQIP